MVIKSENSKISFLRFGPQAIIVRWDSDSVDRNLILRINCFLNHCKQQQLQAHATYNEVLIRFETNIQFDKEVARFEGFLNHKNEGHSDQYFQWLLPVLYDGEDLAMLAEQKGLSIEQVIEKHSKNIYDVHFIGFLPGFPYLSGLDSTIHHPRRATPRPKVAAGSVGIANGQTGIYPIDSPGGWQIIGRCPIPLFDIKNPSPCLLKAGDQIKFKKIDFKTFTTINKSIKNSTYQIEKTKLDG